MWFASIFWMVREEEADAPELLRFSVGDSGNNAIFNNADRWSVLEASATDAERAVLSIAEAMPTSRMKR